MCVIVVKPEDCVVNRTHLTNCGKRNPHGCGYMYVHPETNRVIIRKFRHAGSMLDSYNTVICERFGEKKVPVVLHYRIATVGSVVLDNCHPFFVNDKEEVALAHNGTFNDLTNSVPDDMTDSEGFARFYLSFLTPEHLKHAAVCRLMKRGAGTNKLVLLSQDGTTIIINKNLGVMDAVSGCWFSNNSFMNPSRPTQRTTYFSHNQHWTPTSTGPSSFTKNFSWGDPITCFNCLAVNNTDVEKPSEITIFQCHKCNDILVCPVCLDEPLSEFDLNVGFCTVCGIDIT